MKIFNVTVQGLEGEKGRSLFKMEMNKWDLDLLRDIFNEKDVKRILKIQLSFSNQDDRWIWLGDGKGQYMMKSGYRVFNKLNYQVLPGNVSFKWQKLWNLSIPPKVKKFVWRVLNDCHSTIENLRRRFVDVHSICLVCNLSMESLEHILVSCPFANICCRFSNL